MLWERYAQACNHYRAEVLSQPVFRIRKFLDLPDPNS